MKKIFGFFCAVLMVVSQLNGMQRGKRNAPESGFTQDQGDDKRLKDYRDVLSLVEIWNLEEDVQDVQMEDEPQENDTSTQNGSNSIYQISAPPGHGCFR